MIRMLSILRHGFEEGSCFELSLKSWYVGGRGHLAPRPDRQVPARARIAAGLLCDWGCQGGVRS